MKERHLEEIIAKYPELIEEGLTLKGRQVNIKGKLIDLLFEDRYGQKIIVELKKGTILREHIGQVMDYEGYLLSPDDPNIRVMLIGNRVPPNFRRSLEHHGFEWKEITLSHLSDFLKNIGDNEFWDCFTEEESEVIEGQKKNKISKDSWSPTKQIIPDSFGFGNGVGPFRGYKTSLVRCFRLAGFSFDDLFNFCAWKKMNIPNLIILMRPIGILNGIVVALGHGKC